MEIPTKAVADIAKALGYRRKKVIVRARESVTLNDLNWSGGSRSEYHALRISDGAVSSKSMMNAVAPWENAYEGACVPLAPGLAIIETGHFCGKERIMTIYLHPSDMPKLIPAG